MNDILILRRPSKQSTLLARYGFMMDGSSLAKFASALAAPARARIVIALMGGRAQNATELAAHADVTPQTFSSHVTRLVDVGILFRRQEGRRRYYELANPNVADAIELLHELASGGGDSVDLAPVSIRPARTCYDHLAGRLGVALAMSLHRSRFIRNDGDNFTLTRAGAKFFEGFGVSVEETRLKKRLFARRCIDGTEKVPHLGGALGAAFAERCFELGGTRRCPGGRALVVTAAGDRAFQEQFEIASWAALQKNP